MKRMYGILPWAIIAQAFLLVYLEVIEWVDMFPWNDVRRGNGQAGLDVALGLVMAIAIFATYRRWRVGMIGAVLVYAAWLGLQITTFWTAYIGGASAHWQRIYAANFAQTIQWLPRWGTHLPPDASHFVLQILLAVALVTTAAATVRWHVQLGEASSTRNPPGSDL
ncbi:MAG TPA: hypothetical protein VIF32_00955 [Gemmatimonadaceae bacterium]